MDEQTQDNYEQMMGQASIAGQTQRNASEAAQYYLEEKEKGIIDVQLEVDSIKQEIYHLLKQDSFQLNEETKKTSWIPLKNLSERTLTDWGVERLMQLIHFYINKNNLLTNFSEQQVNRIMLTFMKEVNDLVLLKYQNLFRVPTFEECKTMIEEKVSDRKDMKVFTAQILGKEYNENEITKELMFELEKTLEKEMEKIREEKRKEKIRDYGMLVAQLEVIVYAALNRAFRGEERGSIRRHTQISELIGGRNQQATPQSKGGIFPWGSR